MLLLRVTCVGLAITCIRSCFQLRVVKLCAYIGFYFAADVAAFVYLSRLFVYFLLGENAPNFTVFSEQVSE